MPGSTLVQELPGLKFLLFKLLQGKMELIAACCGVILVLGDHPGSLAVHVVFYLSFPGKPTCLEAPASGRAGVILRSLRVRLHQPCGATRADDGLEGGGS